jgi:hypothetical protein
MPSSTSLPSVVCLRTAYDVTAETARGAVAITGSYLGVLPARFMVASGLHAAVGVDCDGRDGSGAAGLWFLEALDVPALTAGVAEVRLMDGQHVHDHGVASFVNGPAWQLGARVGQPVREAVALLRGPRPATPAEEISRRVTVERLPSGRSIVCLDSIAYADDADRDLNVLCVGGFAGAPNMLRAHPWGIVCSDGGRGVDDVGISGLAVVAEHGIPAAAVTASTARLGDGLSVYEHGVIASRNHLAAALGIEPGTTAREAARILAARAA